MRTRLPDRRTLPSSTDATLSVFAIVGMSTSLPLNENADVRDATRRPRILASTFSSSSDSPSAKYSFSSSRLMLTNGSTAIDGGSRAADGAATLAIGDGCARHRRNWCGAARQQSQHAFGKGSRRFAPRQVRPLHLAELLGHARLRRAWRR